MWEIGGIWRGGIGRRYREEEKHYHMHLFKVKDKFS